VQYLQPPPSPLPLDRIGGIRDLLELLKHETGHHYLALQELGLEDVYHASVDDHAGIQERHFFRLVLPAQPHVGDDDVELILAA